MVKVLFIAYYFPPVGGGGVQRVQKFVRYLPSEGFLPVVVAGPASPEGRKTPHDTSLLADIPSAVRIHRVAGPVPESASKWKRRLESLRGMPSQFSKWWIQSGVEMAAAVAGNASLIFATMPPFESATIADAVSQRLGIPWVADLRDPWAVDEIQVYPTRLHRKLELVKMERILSRAALIVMNTPEAAAAVKRAFPRLSSKNILSISNGFDRADFEIPVSPRTDARFRVVHSGTLLTDAGLQLRRQMLHRLLGGVKSDVDMLTRSPAILIEAITRWCERRPEIRTDLEVVFAGTASGSDQALATSSVVAKLIHFPGYRSHSESLELVRTADLLFLPMHSLPSGERATTAPGKTYEYMASGRPILAAVPDGDAKDFLSQCGTALICRPDDVAGMIQILERVYMAWKSKEPIAHSNMAFVSQFERQKLTRALAGVFRSQVRTEASYV
jgi:glycosyltransferase involved in cell wall biosynthesis